jgi:hypothetical protein
LYLPANTRWRQIEQSDTFGKPPRLLRLLFDWNCWLVLLEYPEHHFRESVRVLAYFP